VVLLLVCLLHDAFAWLRNVIGGLGMLPGERSLRHTVLQASSLSGCIQYTHSFLCVDRDRSVWRQPRPDRSFVLKQVSP
jgi:hypothetical protein